MKRILAILLAACMCFLLCSCGGPSPDELLHDAHSYLSGENGKEQSFDKAWASYL